MLSTMLYQADVEFGVLAEFPQPLERRWLQKGVFGAEPKPFEHLHCAATCTAGGTRAGWRVPSIHSVGLPVNEL